MICTEEDPVLFLDLQEGECLIYYRRGDLYRRITVKRKVFDTRTFFRLLQIVAKLYSKLWAADQKQTEDTQDTQAHTQDSIPQ